MSETQKNGLSEFDLEARRLDTGSSGGYCFVHPRRRRETVRSPPPSFDLENDGSPDDLGDFEESVLTLKLQRPDFEPPPVTPEEPAPAAFAEYRDPELCACSHMLESLQNKTVIVVVNGPVSLPPALYTEEALLSGRLAADRIETAYDGKLWAFRYCPFEDAPIHLIDDQVPASEMLNDGLFCCRTMEQASTHGRVELPPPERHDRLSAKFPNANGPGTFFRTCPWCAKAMIDLGIDRLKHHLIKSRKP